jgi:hypothetical protein
MSDLAHDPLAGLAERINAEHAQVEAAVRSTLGHARAAGDLLLQAKAQVQHGQWLPWLQENVRFKVRTAQGYMYIAREWGRLEAKCATVAHLGVREAFGLLAMPDEPEGRPEGLGLPPGPAAKPSDGPAPSVDSLLGVALELLRGLPDPGTGLRPLTEEETVLFGLLGAARPVMDAEVARLQAVLDLEGAPLPELLEVRDKAAALQRGWAEVNVRIERRLGQMLNAQATSEG